MSDLYTAIINKQKEADVCYQKDSRYQLFLMKRVYYDT